jgi:hypothetical protein
MTRFKFARIGKGAAAQPTGAARRPLCTRPERLVDVDGARRRPPASPAPRQRAARGMLQQRHTTSATHRQPLRRALTPPAAGAQLLHATSQHASRRRQQPVLAAAASMASDASQPSSAGAYSGSPRICVLGGGFGGLYTAIKLDSLIWPKGKKPQVRAAAAGGGGATCGGGSSCAGPRPALCARVADRAARPARAAAGHADRPEQALCVQAAAVRAAEQHGQRGRGGADV